MTRELIGIRYSPWTQKARWPLEHHGIAYRYSEHLMMVGIPLLCLKSSRWNPDVTVPTMICEDEVLPNSFAIARWADRQGKGASLFPDAQMGAIEEWNTRSDGMLESGRLLLTQEMLREPRSLAEAMPPLMRLLPGSMVVAKQAARYVLRRYDRPGDRTIWLDTLEKGLTSLRQALNGGDYLLGSFTFADIAMATALQMVAPPTGRYVQMGPISRRCWTRTELVDGASDLLAWRDRIFERHAPRGL